MIDILIPVLGRPWNAQPVVDSIVASTDNPYRIVFICSPNDQHQYSACRKTGQETWIIGWKSDHADFAKKINWAFTQTSGAWVFQGADDVRFSPHWDTHALAVAGEDFHVIGTNDLHNPGSKRGTHSTHTLIRRSYIEEYGGTFDNTGLVFSEAYDHQFVDNEFIETARRRGVFAPARDSVVEHLHPTWKGAEWDATYAKALRNTNADARIFYKRLRRMSRTQ